MQHFEATFDPTMTPHVALVLNHFIQCNIALFFLIFSFTFQEIFIFSTILIALLSCHDKRRWDRGWVPICTPSRIFFIFYFFTYGWNFTDTHNFTLQHRRESCIIALLCGTYQPRLCALELLPKEFTGEDLWRSTQPRHT